MPAETEMPYAKAAAAGIDPEALRQRVDTLKAVMRPRYRRLWDYYENPLDYTTPDPARPYRQAHEQGMPARLTGDVTRGGDPTNRKEICVENDIRWRVNAKVEYLVGKPLIIRCAAPTASRRRAITAVMRGIMSANGGMTFLQHAALFAGIYGFADWLVRPAEDKPFADPMPPIHRHNLHDRYQDSSDFGEEPAADDDATAKELAAARRLGGLIDFDLVEPNRALPLISDQDWRNILAYTQVYELPAKPATIEKPRWWSRNARNADRARTDECLDLITPTLWQRYRNGQLLQSGVNPAGLIPLVHLPGDAHPFTYVGTGDVEPLIPLQDELNTRITDRAHRLAMQAFKMYLGKGIDHFVEKAIGPGQMWEATDPNAKIDEFGGDTGAPSEDQHIADLRDALDKESGVSPVAAGAIKNRLGNLTSAVALRITLVSLLSITLKRRAWMGQALQRSLDLALHWLDIGNHFHTTPEERRIEISWPSPLPENLAELLAEATTKLALGVPRPIVLAELGYNAATEPQRSPNNAADRPDPAAAAAGTPATVSADAPAD